jgi:hypothetical protein
MHITATIHQIYSDRAFFNVLDEPGQVQIWGSCHKQPTILVQDGGTFYFIQFDNEAYYDEWMSENEDKYTLISFIQPVSRTITE